MLREYFQKQLDPVEHHTEQLRRIPLMRKTTAVADAMDIGEIKEKIGQYCQLWELFADTSCKLTAKSKVSQQEAARACKVYRPYICYILEQVDAVITLFMMEKELRNLKGKGQFPIPQITPKGIRIKPPHNVKKALGAVDKVVVQILNTIRESERILGRKRKKAGSENNKQEQVDQPRGQNTTS